MTDTEVVELESHSRAVALAAAAPTTGQGDGRTVDVLLCRWEHPERVSDDGRTFYTEVFARGGLRLPVGTPVVARLDHDPDEFPGRTSSRAGRDGVIVGRLVASHARADGLYGTLRIVDNPDGERLRGLIDPTEPIIDRLSIEFDDWYQPVRPGATVVRSDAQLSGLVFTLNPQRGDARVLAVRSTHQEQPTMSDTPTPAPEVPPAPSDDTTTQTSARSADADTPQVVHSARTVVRPGPALGSLAHDVIEAHRELAAFATFGHYARARASARDNGEELGHHLYVATEAGAQRRRFARAFEDATSTDIAGLLPVQWLGEVIDLYNVLAPTVANWSTTPMPEKGMTISQPIVGDRPAPTVESELGEPGSNKVTVTSVSWSVLTYAGGQGMSIQAIQRSEPSYIDIVMRLYVQEMARTRNTAAATVLLAAADDVNVTATEYVSAEVFPDNVIDVSAVFLNALGRPAEVVAMSIQLWAALGKAKDTTDRYMFPDIAGMNVVGTFDATSPQGQIRRLSYYVEPAWGNTDIKGVIGVRDAFRTSTGAIQTLTADVPGELSRDIAVFQYAAHGKADATGLYLIANAA